MTAERKIHGSALEAKVAAVNRANAEAKRLHPLFVEAFRPFLGKKVLTHSGLVAKAKDIPDQLVPFIADGYQTPSVYRYSSNYSLCFVVKVCESGRSFRGGDNYSTHYAEASIYVGELDGYTLAKLTEEYKFPRDDWSADEVRDLRKLADEAEKQSRHYLNQLSAFGRFDQ